MSASLNTAEKSLLQYWLADGAPGYTDVVPQPNGNLSNASLQNSDYVAIGALDDDTVRKYLSKYRDNKISLLGIQAAKQAAAVSSAQRALTEFQTTLATISALTIQTIPTT